MSSREYFQRVASQWDEMRKRFFTDAVREKAIDVAGVSSGKVAADIGAGTGFITEGLLKQGLKVIAVDQSGEMLAVMRRKLGAAVGVEYREGEACDLPVAPGEVDYVFANMYLHHVEDPLEAIREMARMLRPGGRLVITDLDEHNYTFLQTEQNDRWMGFKREDVKGWMAQAGLSGVNVDCVGEDCCVSSGSGEEAKVSIFVAWGDK